MDRERAAAQRERRDARCLVEQAIASDFFGPEPFGPHRFDPQARAAERDAPPAVPDKYELARCLGRGGAGVVWLARDRVLERDVALKLLHESQSGLLHRFRREARFIARLESRSIVEVHELGEHEGVPYIAMQYVDGGNLADAQLELDELLRVLREVALALQHAHEQGIVHRDIKPENVLIDRAGRAYLTDFGIALDLWAGAGATLSLDGQILGTPSAMAPEQARGELHAVDARSDVYALGASLYRKLAGRWPFDGETVVDVLHAVIHAEPQPLGALAQGVPASVEALVMRCLAKDRRDRPASMAELASELERCLAGGELARRDAIAVEQRARARSANEDEAYFTLGLEAARTLAVFDADLYRVSRNLPRLFPELDQLLARLDHHLARQPEAAWARYYRAQALLRLGRLDAALDDLERAIDRVGHRAGALFELGRLQLALAQREHARARGHLVETAVKRHMEPVGERLALAAQAFSEARGWKEAVLPRWQMLFADAVARVAEDDFDGCVALCDAVLALDPDAEEAWKLRGDALAFAGADPFESWERAAAIRRSYWQVWLAAADERRKRGELELAQECIERALAIHPELVDALVLGARVRLGAHRACASRERLDAGAELARRAIVLDPEHYEARVTSAELELELARIEQSVPRIDAAIRELAFAATLEGCWNRAELLGAGAHLQRARLIARQGGDPTPDLERVLEFRDRPTTRNPGGEPWRRLIVRARRELAALRRVEKGERA